MRYLTLREIIHANQRTVERHGGNFVPPRNILNESPLLYLIDAVNAEMFGAPLYPTVADKAALYLHAIITGHIFQDGNKRTGLAAALAFLTMNGYFVYDENGVRLGRDELFAFTMSVASGEQDLDAVKAWFAERVHKTK